MSSSLKYILALTIAVALSGVATSQLCTPSNPCGQFSCYELAEWSAYLCACPNGIVMNNSCSNSSLATVCSSNVCLNGGTCRLLNPNQFTCSCPINFSGQYCEIELFRPNTCNTVNPCQNGGFCSQLPNNIDFRCSCPVTTTGLRCERTISACDSNPNLCRNGGTCFDVLNNGIPVNYTCVCASGYSGSNCETATDPCLNQTCSGNGLCFNAPAGQSRCVCFSGWTGTNCETQLVCDPTRYPCLNGGNCTMGGTQCSCQSSFFSGPRCEQINAPFCTVNACSNGGTCYQLNRTLYCSCIGNYYGQFCDFI